MAVAGDGQTRSERRRRNRTISLRVTPQEKARLIRRAQTAGYPGLSSWVMDQLADCPALSHRDRIRIVAWIGRIGQVLSNLCADLDIMGHPEVALSLDRIGQDAAHLQKLLMDEGDHAG